MTVVRTIGLTLICSLLCAGLGYVSGKKQGRVEGTASTAREYDFWAQSFMYRDPNVRLDAVLLVPDGARISRPSCTEDEQAFIRLARRPDATLLNDADIEKESEYWLARIPQGKDSSPPLGAALVGCRKVKNAVEVKSLIKSWEFPSTLKN